jgi:hypothetical protein
MTPPCPFLVALGTNDLVGSSFYYVFYVVWYFGCFNIAAVMYADVADQGTIRSACMLGINTEFTHTFTLNYSDVTLPE